MAILLSIKVFIFLFLECDKMCNKRFHPQKKVLSKLKKKNKENMYPYFYMIVKI